MTIGPGQKPEALWVCLEADKIEERVVHANLNKLICESHIIEVLVFSGNKNSVFFAAMYPEKLVHLSGGTGTDLALNRK